MTRALQGHRGDDARRRLLVSLVIAVLAHALLLAALMQWTRARPPPPRAERAELEVRLIASPRTAAPEAPEAPAVPAVPEPARSTAAKRPVPASAPAAPPRRVSSPAPVLATEAAPPDIAPSPADETARAAEPSPVEPRHDLAPAARAPSSTPTSADTPTLRLFHPDGSIDLPDTDAHSGDPAAFGSRKRVAPYSPDPMVHRSPLPYTPTRFEGMWAPRDESLLGEWVRNATRSKTWDTQGGTRISCSAFLFFGGCGWGPTPRVSIEELKRMRADPPMPRPAPLLPLPADER